MDGVSSENPDAWRYQELRRLDYPWGWKDPRNVYTVDLWKEIFPAARVLHIYRHPLDVARSLQRREQRHIESLRDSAKIRKAEKELKRRPLYLHLPWLLDLRYGVSLWERYVGSALQKSQAFGNDVMHCKFEAFLEHPAAHLAEIVTFLSLDVPRETIDRVAGIAKLDRSLAYASDPELAAHADEIKDLPLVRALGYA